VRDRRPGGLRPGPWIFVGPHKAPIGIVFQSLRDWPHMTVIENVCSRCGQPPRPGRPIIKTAGALGGSTWYGLEESRTDGARRSRRPASRGSRRPELVPRPQVADRRALKQPFEKGLRGRMRRRDTAVSRGSESPRCSSRTLRPGAGGIQDVVVMNGGQHHMERGCRHTPLHVPRDMFTAAS